MMKLENKKNTLLTIMIILTCLVIIGTCIYFIYDNVKVDNNSKNENNSKIENKVDKDNNVDESKKEEHELNEIELEVTDEDKVLAQELIDKFKILNGGINGIHPVLYEKKITLSTDLNNDIILELALYQYVKKENPFSNLDWSGKGSVIVSSTKIKNYVNDIFGKKFTYRNDDIPAWCFSCVNGSYDSNNDIYVFSRPENGCGGTGLPFIIKKIQDVKKYNDRIEVTEKIGYIEYYTASSCLGTILYNHPTEKVLIEKSSCNDTYPDVLFDNNSDKLTSYKWTFKKDGTNYYFEKIERVN